MRLPVGRCSQITSLLLTSQVHADLDAAANQLVQSEITALASALQPFVNPVAAFANAAATLSIGAQVSGLRSAVTGVLTILARIIASIGL